MPEVEIRAEAGGAPLPALLKHANLTASTSEALRMIDQGAVRVDGEKVGSRDARLEAGQSYVIQVGKRKFARVLVK